MLLGLTRQKRSIVKLLTRHLAAGSDFVAIVCCIDVIEGRSGNFYSQRAGGSSRGIRSSIPPHCEIEASHDERGS